MFLAHCCSTLRLTNFSGHRFNINFMGVLISSYRANALHRVVSLFIANFSKITPLATRTYCFISPIFMLCEMTLQGVCTPRLTLWNSVLTICTACLNIKQFLSFAHIMYLCIILWINSNFSKQLKLISLWNKMQCLSVIWNWIYKQFSFDFCAPIC